MSVKRLLEELDELESTDDEFVEEDNEDILADLANSLDVFDEEGNLVPEHIYANDLLLTYEITEADLIKLIKENGGNYKLFKVTPNEVFDGGLVIGNKACTIEQIKERLASDYEEEGIEFEVVGLGEEEKVEEGAQGKRVKGKEYVIYDASKDGVAPIKAIRKTYTEARWYCNKPANFGKDLGIEEVPEGRFEVGDDFYGPFDANWNKVESIKEEKEDFIYYCISDGMNPKNSMIVPNGDGAKERAMEIAKNSKKYKYVSRFTNGNEVVIWHSKDFDPKGMNVKLEKKLKGKMEVAALDGNGGIKAKELIGIDGEYDSEEILKRFFELHPDCRDCPLSLNYQEEPLKEGVKEGPSNLFGYVNGDLKSFEPKDLVEKVKSRKQSLHTNRIVKDTDDVKICHHIVVDVLGWGYEPEVFVDVVEETWTRNSGYDADDIRSYQGEIAQDRILMKNCGKGEEGFAKAVEVLEKYKKEALDKNGSLD